MADVVTLDQVRALIRSEKIRPSDLFEMENLAADPVVKGFAEDRVRSRIAEEFARRREAEEALEKLKKEAGPEREALQEEIRTLKITATKGRVGELLDKQKTARKLDDLQLKFIQTRLNRFTPTKPEEAEKEFSAYIDAELDECTAIQETFGIKPAGNPKPGDKKTGGEPDPKPGPAGDDPYLDPATNPMIKAD